MSAPKMIPAPRCPLVAGHYCTEPETCLVRVQCHRIAVARQQTRPRKAPTNPLRKVRA